MTMYHRGRIPATEIPENVTYYAIPNHIERIYTIPGTGYVFAEILADALVEPEPFIPDPDIEWMVAWTVPIQRADDKFRIMYSEMSEQDRLSLLIQTGGYHDDTGRRTQAGD